VHVPANPSLPPLLVNVRRNPESAEQREALPYQNHSLESIKEGELADGLKFFTRGKFVESLEAFRKVFAKALLVVVKTDTEAVEVSVESISVIAYKD
jgi:coatomer protein complex subunit alpha (xenin)